MQPNLTSLMDRLMALARREGLSFAGLDGGGGAGKTTLALELAAVVPSLRVVHLDDFYLPPEQRPVPEEIGSAYDWKRLEREVLIPLLAGRPARYSRLDWPNGAAAEEVELRPEGVVLVEGVTALRRSLRSYYALTIWLDVPEEERRARGLARDGAAWAVAWESDWLPQERAYHAAEQPWVGADAFVRMG